MRALFSFEATPLCSHWTGLSRRCCRTPASAPSPSSQVREGTKKHAQKPGRVTQPSGVVSVSRRHDGSGERRPRTGNVTLTKGVFQTCSAEHKNKNCSFRFKEVMSPLWPSVPLLNSPSSATDFIHTAVNTRAAQSYQQD